MFGEDEDEDAMVRSLEFPSCVMVGIINYEMIMYLVVSTGRAW